MRFQTMNWKRTRMIKMKSCMANLIPELYLCPFCQFIAGDWDIIIEHFIESHSDSKAYDLGISPCENPECSCNGGDCDV